MKMFVSASFACVLAASAVLAAQETNPVSSALRAAMERYEKNIVGAAEIMPAGKFSTRPTPQQMTFGELVRHVTAGNTMICSWIAGAQPPSASELPESAGKDALVGALRESFARCRSALSAADDSKLGEEVPFFGGRKVTRAAAMLDLAADWGDHYSLMATELRVAGLLPPTAQAKAGGK
jgi:hypothetical protein